MIKCGPLDAKSEKLFVGDTVVIVNPGAFDRGKVARIKAIHGNACAYTDSKHYDWARHSDSLVKIPSDIAHDPKLIDAFLVLSGLREPSDASDT